MKEEEIPDYNIFMACPQLNRQALSEIPAGYHIRNCREHELERWKAFPFDSDSLPAEHAGWMNQFVRETYGQNMDLFFRNTLLACDREDQPVATCSHWKAYGKINTIHWFKTLKSHEGKGIGRALLSAIMQRFTGHDYPVYLHTQPGSFRAIKLYSDFGFHLLRGGKLGARNNELEQSLPILKEFMPRQAFESLEISDTPGELIQLLADETSNQF